MDYKLYIQNSPDGKIFEIQNLASTITVTQNLDGTAGKLTTVLQKDPNKLLSIGQGTLSNGSWIWLRVNGNPFFYGRVFSIGTDMSGELKITAYDNLRYLKNSDFCYYKGMKASDIFADVCKRFNLKYEIKEPTNYIPPQYVADNATLYSIIKRGMDLASINDKRRYFITDVFGILTWSSLDVEKTNVQLGDGTLLTSYTYEKSIDNDTYNKIKVYRKNETSGKVDTWTVEDTDNQKKWGILQLLQQADDKLNPSQIKVNAENLLKVKNREKETLRIQGDGILELVAGRGVKIVISEHNIDKWLWITSSSHTFAKELHTMDLEVRV